MREAVDGHRAYLATLSKFFARKNGHYGGLSLKTIKLAQWFCLALEQGPPLLRHLHNENFRLPDTQKGHRPFAVRYKGSQAAP
jgi:hypothetical protein